MQPHSVKSELPKVKRLDYVGCGSSETPDHILGVMTSVARLLAGKGLTLRVSDQKGADVAFRRGSGGRYFMYTAIDTGFPGAIPAEITGGSRPTLARRLNPRFPLLPRREKQWEITAVSVVAGFCTTNLAKMLICWTPDGAVKPEEFTERTGDTARYLRIANQLGVPVYNLARERDLKTVASWLCKE